MCKYIFYDDVVTYDTAYYPTGSYIVEYQPLIHNMANELYKLLKDSRKHILLVCKGASGTILASGVACRLFDMGWIDLSIGVVRKEGERSHSSKRIDTLNLSKDDLITVVIDDFICTGSTMRSITENMKLNKLGLDILMTGDKLEYELPEVTDELADNFKYRICYK